MDYLAIWRLRTFKFSKTCLITLGFSNNWYRCLVTFLFEIFSSSCVTMRINLSLMFLSITFLHFAGIHGGRDVLFWWSWQFHHVAHLGSIRRPHSGALNIQISLAHCRIPKISFFVAYDSLPGILSILNKVFNLRQVQITYGNHLFFQSHFGRFLFFRNLQGYRPLSLLDLDLVGEEEWMSAEILIALGANFLTNFGRLRI